MQKRYGQSHQSIQTNQLTEWLKCLKTIYSIVRFLQVKKVRDVVDRMNKPQGLYPNYINPRSGAWGQSKFSILYTMYCSYIIWLLYLVLEQLINNIHNENQKYLFYFRSCFSWCFGWQFLWISYKIMDTKWKNWWSSKKNVWWCNRGIMKNMQLFDFLGWITFVQITNCIDTIFLKLSNTSWSILQCKFLW